MRLASAAAVSPQGLVRPGRQARKLGDFCLELLAGEAKERLGALLVSDRIVVLRGYLASFVALGGRARFAHALGQRFLVDAGQDLLRLPQPLALRLGVDPFGL